MGTNNNNLLAHLSLSGLSEIENEQGKGVAKLGAMLKSASQDAVGLGVLAQLAGTWVGTGFNIIEVPNMNQAKPGPPPADKFRVIVNNTSETITFSPIGGDIINRGNAQEDISYKGIHYLQQVSDVNLPPDNNGIHLETGLFLNLPAGTDPKVTPTIARLGSIPHGDSLLAQGSFITIKGGPTFDVADPTPFTLVDGKRVNDTSEAYLSILKNVPVPTGIPSDVIMNPNLLLQRDIEGQEITEMVVIFLDANPMDGVANKNAVAPVGGISNIPFITTNANATSMSAIFWIETVKNSDGSTFLQLQYTQTVILEFPVFGADGKTPVNIMWPHISVATLRKQ